MTRLSILGSTGSIGTQTLQVVDQFPDRLQVVALSAGRNVDLLIQQIKQYRPSCVAVGLPDDAARVRTALADERIRVHCGAEGLLEVATEPSDLVIGALVGSVGLEPIVAALRAGTDVALANKEVLVSAGRLVMEEARRHGARLRPLDSEHVAIHQCIAGHPEQAVSKIWLTASGGPFRCADLSEMEAATPERALAHPNWDMGPKISIDSATLMNKGFELIEARWLFDLPPERIGVLVHPESVIHSLVEYCDGSWLAQLGVPDMRIPIAYTLGMPDRLPLANLSPLDLVSIGSLNFEAPDAERFPALRLATQVLEDGGTAPAVLNAANEVAVEAFLAGRISFTAIAQIAEKVLAVEAVRPGLDLEEIRDSDRQSRQRAREMVEEWSA
ncbi:MAG: 1-deoxy-D-xylulose-5-phosphate reductoisomerase [bacterium]|nr:1-deoxy-D-xylulose-5-phosphate reductoisomerase [bacterium]